MQFDRPPFPPGPIRDGLGRPINDPRQSIVYGWRISSLFGGRLDPFTGRPSNHGGMDIVMPLGTPLIQCIKGLCQQFWDTGGGGNWSNVYYPVGVSRVGYGHAQRYQPSVAGTSAPAGRVIAYADSTGSSTGNHLHLSVDDEDADSAWDDPFVPLYDVCVRFAGAGSLPPNITPPPTQEPDDMYSDQDRLIAQQTYDAVKPGGGVITTLGEYHNDTRLILVEGMTAITAMSDEQIIATLSAGKFDSRDFAFCYPGKPAVLQWVDAPDGRRRQWIGVYRAGAEHTAANVDVEASQELLRSLVKTKLNPFIVVLDEPGIEAIHDTFAPMVGVLPPAA